MKVKHAQIQGIWSLPDELVFRILISVPEYRPNCVVDVLPLVCKNWREILYLQGERQFLPPEVKGTVWHVTIILGVLLITPCTCRAAHHQGDMPGQ